MSDANGQRASELAARQVEQIVSAAQAAAEQIRNEALAESEAITDAAERDAETLIEDARRSAQENLKEAGTQAIILEKDARRDAEGVLEDAEHEAVVIREKARRSVDGRVVAAERAAAEVLEEARALSGGLRQLGKALESHADRILRDVTAAHKRMQADLRVGRSFDDGPDEGPAAPPAEDDGPGALPRVSRLDPSTRRARSSSRFEREEPSRPKRGNPFEEIDVPSWVGRER
jgi:cell division septum initiation protein DivIVA